MNFSLLILIYLSFNLGGLQAINTAVDDYIAIVSTFYRERNVRVLTHFTCFSLRDNAEISIAFSKMGTQSRFISEFRAIKRLVDTSNHTVQGFIVNKKCQRIHEIFRDEAHGIIFKNNNIWLFIDNNLDTEINKTIDRYKLEFNDFDAMPISEVFIAKQLRIEPIQWMLFDAYKLNYGYDIEISPNGMIETMQNNIICLNGTNFSSVRRQNLRGVNVNCGLVLAYPERFTYLEDPSNNHIDVFTKATILFGRNLFEDLNINCQIAQTDSYGWPKNKSNLKGEWNGAIGLFQKRKIQITSHGVNMRFERLTHCEFAGDIFTPRTPLIFRQPPLSSVANIFVLPLDMSVWKCMIVFLILAFIIMVIQLTHPLLKSLPISSLDIVTFIWGALCQQGTHLHIPTTSGRLVVLTTFLATLALFTSYSASIVALLQSPSHFIKTIDDLIASPLKVGFHESGYLRFNVNSNYSGVSEVYTKKVLPQGEAGWIYDPLIGVEKVRSELFAFQVDSPSAYKAISRTYTESEKCSISKLQMIILPRTTFLVERNSGYKELIRQR